MLLLDGLLDGVQREREEDVPGGEAVAETASPAAKRVKVRRCHDIIMESDNEARALQYD